MKIRDIPNINYFWGELIVEELVRNGVTKFFIAPGSRSTPLALSVARCQKAEKLIHFDERGLGFYALGVSSAGKDPTVLISTSGTAVANFLPSVIEASKKKVPLIILTADRPPELRKTGSHQTIHQPGIYGNYVRWDFDLPVPDENIIPEMVLTTIDQAVFMSKNPLPGPVHINCMFREPLAPQKKGGKWNTSSSLNKDWIRGNKPFTKYYNTDDKPKKNDLKNISEIINNSMNGIIVVGKLKNDKEVKSVIKLSEKLSWAIFPDITSGLRLSNASDNTIHYYDQILLSDIFTKNNIDTIIHLGGRITSKRYYKFIEKVKPSNYITVLNHPLRNDPLHTVSHRIKSTVRSFIDSILPQLTFKKKSELLSQLRVASNLVDKRIDNFIGERDLNEIFISREISKIIKHDNILFLSNSMPVRDMDMYASPMKWKIYIGGNRGASGIDGIIASACGYSSSLRKPLTLLIGDLSFLHDINSLSLIKKSNNQIIIVVINNNGGSIFSFLPVAEYKTDFEQYFTAPHGMNFEYIAKQFGIKYFRVSSGIEFSKKYSSALEQSENIIMEVEINIDKNISSHKELQSLIKIDLDKKYG